MKSEKELINQIRMLREIKPEKDWVVSCKARVMGQAAIKQNSSFSVLAKNLLFQYRAALAGLILAIGTAGGLFASAQTALPGEPLYGLKKTAEKGVAMITGRSDSAVANLSLAAKRLEEIDIISQKNLAQNLPAAFYEYNTAKAEAKKGLAAIAKNNPDRAGEIAKEAARTMKNIDDKEKQIYAVLGMAPEDASAGKEEVASDKQIIESLIIYFNGNELLSFDQAADLNKVRGLYSSGDYSRAIDYYLNSSLNQ